MGFYGYLTFDIGVCNQPISNCCGAVTVALCCVQRARALNRDSRTQQVRSPTGDQRDRLRSAEIWLHWCRDPTGMLTMWGGMESSPNGGKNGIMGLNISVFNML